MNDALLLQGFEFAPNAPQVQLYVGKRNRIYLKGDVQSALTINPGDKIYVAFNRMDERFAIVKPSSEAIPHEMIGHGYVVSRKFDVACAYLFRRFNLSRYEGITFILDVTSDSGSVIVFKRENAPTVSE